MESLKCRRRQRAPAGWTRRRALAASAAMLAGASAGALAAACSGPAGGGDAPAAAPAGPASNAPATLQYLSFFGPTDPQNVLFPHALEVFRQQHPNVSVEQTTTAGSGGNVMEKFLALIAAGTPPDVAAVNPQFLEPLRAKGALADLTGYVKRDARSFQPDDFYEPTLLRAIRGGKWYAIPLQMGLWFLFFHAGALSAAGLGKPDGTWTWDRVLEAVRTAQARDPSLLGMTMPPYELPVRDNGGDILSADEKQCVLDQAPAVEAIQWNGDLRQKHHVVPEPDQTAGQDARHLWDSGRYVFHIGDPGFLSGTVRNNLSFPWDIAIVPRGKVAQVDTVKGPSLVLSAESKQKDLAWLWLAHYDGTEMQRYVAVEAKIVSARKSAVQAFVGVNEGYNKQVILQAAAIAKPMPYVARYDEIDREIQAGLDAVYAGRQTAKAAMAEVVRKVNDILSGAA